MKLKFSGNQAKGLERACALFGITREDFDFEGKIERLERDSKIETINGSIFGEPPRRHYKIILNQNLTRKEILSLIAKYGFEEPINVTGNEDMKCTEHSLHTELTFPYPKQKLSFSQPYEIKEPLKTQEL
jgi:hypothetical protein